MNDDSNRTDGELLAAFAATGDESAFAEIMRRHGAMVHGVCRSVLADHHEAQDVTQATFLTLARKAGSLRRDPSVGGWLHRVAWCLARDVLSSRVSRRHREEEVMRMREPAMPVGGDSVTAEVNAAVAALPERYRMPLVLFHLEGQSLEQTAGQLGLNPKTASTRLVRGRDLLRRRLTRQGVAVASVGALTTLLSAEAGAAVLPASFVTATVKAAGLAAAGKLAVGVGAGTISANVAALTKGAVKMILVAKIKMVAAVVVACALTVGTVAVVAQQAGAPAHAWMTKTEGGPIDVNHLWGTFDRLEQTGELVILVQPAGGQGGGVQPAPVEVRLKIVSERVESVRKAAATLTKGAKVKVGYVRDSSSRERFVWDLSAL